MAEHAPSDEELESIYERSGVRQVYVAGWDAAIAAVRDYQDKDREFIENLHKIVREMGFTPLGLSSEQEILHALDALSRRPRS